MLTVVHAGSGGTSASFPDVCKTPSPGGPIPIPYPNIAQSSDTADGSSTVKVDGNPIMLKGSNFRMSSGDEAGSAMGVVSNKIKGKALPVNASFDVKVDGQNVFRLTDPMQTNASNPVNAFSPAEVQAPKPEGTFRSEECEKIKDKRSDQKGKVASSKSGIYPPHFPKIKKVAVRFKVIFYIRQTGSQCMPWIAAKHQPKPHAVFKANTIKGDKLVQQVDVFLRHFVRDLRKRKIPEAGILAEINAAAHPMATNVAYCTDASAYVGVIGEPVTRRKRKPLRAIKAGVKDSGLKYTRKWITGDYDLYQILYAVEGCKEVNQKGRTFSKIRKAINKSCKWDAIQHGPQAQWVPTEKEIEHGAPDISFPEEMKAALSSGNVSRTIKIPGRTKPMNVIDDKVTVIAPEGNVFLETQQDTFDALKCRECGSSE